MDDIVRSERKQSIAQRAEFGRWVLIVFIDQVAAVNVWMFGYGIANDWQVSESVIVAWLGSTVADILGVVLIAMKSLFPENRP